MSQQQPTDGADELQFEVVEPTAPAAGDPAAAPARACIGCRQPITGTYYAAGDRLICPACRAQIDAPPPGPAVGRLATAALKGTLAGLLGAAIWFAIRHFAHLQIGLVAVLVGFMVGKAVRNGSGNRGGRGYQIMAVAITYACVAANYMPDVWEAMMRHTARHDLPTALRLVNAFVVSLEVPFLMAPSSPIGLLIIGFALWEAWKFTAARRLAITGPHQAGTPVVRGAFPVGVRR